MTAISHAEEPTAAVTDPWPTTRQGYYAVFIFQLTLVVNFLDRGIVSLLVGPIERDLHLSDLQISLIIGFAFVFFYVVLGFPIARLIDSKSRRMILGWGVAVWSVMTALCGLAQNFGSLFIFRVGVGVGEACTGPSTFSMMADLFPREKLARANAVLQFGIMAGTAASLIIGGAIVDLFSGIPPVEVPLIGTIHGWQMVFFMIGIPGLIVALLIRTVPEPRRRGLVHGNSVPLREVFGFIGRNFSTYGMLFLGMGFTAVLLGGTLAWTPTFFIRTYGWTPAHYGLMAGIAILCLQPLGAITGSFLAEWFARKNYDDANLRVGVIAACCTLPCYVLFPLMPTAELSFVFVCLSFFFSVWAAGPVNAGLQMITPNRMRGQLTASSLLIYNVIGFGIGPTLVPLLGTAVFHSENALGYALSLTAGLLCPLGILVYWRALEPYGRSVALSRSWG